jgi:hypothetical protein
VAGWSWLVVGLFKIVGCVMVEDGCVVCTYVVVGGASRFRGGICRFVGGMNKLTL